MNNMTRKSGNILKNASIRGRFLLMIIPIFIVVFMLVIYLNFNFSKRILIGYLMNEGINQTNKIADIFRNVVVSCEINAKNLTNSIELFEDISDKKLSFLIRNMLRQNPDFYSIKIIKIDQNSKKYSQISFIRSVNDIVESSKSNLFYEDKINYNKKSIFSMKVSTWGGPYVDTEFSNKSIISYFEPVIDYDQKVRGFVVIDLSFDNFVEKLRSINYSILGKMFLKNILSDKRSVRKYGSSKNLGYAFIISSTGENISNPMVDERKPNDRFFGYFLNAQIKKLSAVVLNLNLSRLGFTEFIDPFTLKKSYVVSSYLKLGDHNGLYINAAYFDEIFSSVRNIFYFSYVSVSVLIIVLMIFLIVKTSASVTAPLEKLVKQTEEYAHGNFSSSLEEDNAPFEIKKLSKAFNSMGRAIDDYIKELNKTQLEIIYYLTKAAEYRDKDTGSHLKRMSMYTDLIADKLGMSAEDKHTLSYASVLHDIGKIGLADSVLKNPGSLTEKEWEIIKNHPIIGAEILKGSDSKILKMASDISLNHHEKWDGTGYPNNKKGEEIPLAARIVSISDVFDALLSERVYKKEWSVEEAVNEIKKGSGTHFDPMIVNVFIELLPEILRIRQTTKDEEDPNE